MKSIACSRIIFSCLLLGFSSLLFAGNNSGQQPINNFKVDKDRVVIYAQNGTFQDDASCSGGTTVSTGVAISTSRDEFKELYAAVMLAHANNRNISFWLDGGCSPATAGGPYPTASMVYVH